MKSNPLEKQVGGSHYQSKGVQHTTFCQRNRIPWNESSAIKYLTRWRRKNGIQDLEKARHYMEFAAQEEYLLREESGLKELRDMDPKKFPVPIKTFLADNNVEKVEGEIITLLLHHQVKLGESTIIECIKKLDKLIKDNQEYGLLS